MSTNEFKIVERRQRDHGVARQVLQSFVVDSGKSDEAICGTACDPICHPTTASTMVTSLPTPIHSTIHLVEVMG